MLCCAEAFKNYFMYTFKLSSTACSNILHNAPLSASMESGLFFLQQFYGQKHKYELEFLLKCYFGKCTCGEQIFKAAVSTTLQMN